MAIRADIGTDDDGRLWAHCPEYQGEQFAVAIEGEKTVFNHVESISTEDDYVYVARQYQVLEEWEDAAVTTPKLRKAV